MAKLFSVLMEINYYYHNNIKALSILEYTDQWNIKQVMATSLSMLYTARRVWWSLIVTTKARKQKPCPTNIHLFNQINQI